MASLNGLHDPTGGETQAPRNALPAGDYVAALVKSEGKETKNRDGYYIECEFEVMDGAHKGRRFWTNFNLQNRSQQATEIGWRQFNSLSHACGRVGVQDTSELHGIPVIAKLRVKTDAQYGDKNEVSSFSPMNGAAPQTNAGHAPQPQRAASDGGAPWQQGRR